MIAGDDVIKAAIASGAWKSNVPLAKLKIGPNSIDVTLGRELQIAKGGTIYPEFPLPFDAFEEYIMSDRGCLIHPGDAILAVTNEQFDCDAPDPKRKLKWIQHYDGRSTMGRLFLASHVTAAFGDYGFKGKWTLEIVNLGPFTIRLFPGMRIGQVFFTSTSDPSLYDGAYVDQDGPKLPVLGENRV